MKFGMLLIVFSALCFNMLTFSNAFAEDVQLSLEAGMNEHIPKPIEIDKLYSVMGKWFH